VTDKLDVSDGRRLLRAASPTGYDTSVSALEDWLWNNREALIAATEELEALRRCVEAADEVYVDTTTMLMRARVDRYKEARSALDALRSGKPERTVAGAICDTATLVRIE
jgi:hypothetical protein